MSAPRAGLAAHLPNILTLGRIAAVPVVVALLFLPDPTARFWAAAVFALASFTDFVDGWLARKLNAQSGFGTMLDPIADKLIVASILVMLVATEVIGGVHVVAVLLILGRELFVSGLREFLAGRAVRVPVSRLAKWKTAVQMGAIIALLILPPGAPLAVGLLWVAAALSLYTGASYALATRPS